MIQSMTGYGSADKVVADVYYVAELRSVNHRYLKVSIRLPEHLQFAEAGIEKLLRGGLSRGSVTCTLRVRDVSAASGCGLHLPALQAYADQIARVQPPRGVTLTLDLATLASLPGVCETPELDEPERLDRQSAMETVVGSALAALIQMRTTEGTALREALLSFCSAIEAEVDAVTVAAPRVVEEYRQRLQARVSMLMAGGGFELEVDSLAREVAIFAERCDVTEELTRLRSHLQQFGALLDSPDQVGRKLDFLTQELLREANTIASKSNDAEITRRTVEMKTVIDRLKEQVQNVE